MNPVERSDHDVVYKGEHEGPDGVLYNEGVGDLSCRRVQTESGTAIVAHFRPSLEELQILTRGGHVELAIFTEPIPPISIVAVPQPEESDA